jgi:hypothetical protein
MKAFFGFLLSLLSIILLSSGAFALDLFQRRDLVIPRTVLGNISLGGMTRDEVREIIRAKLQSFTEQSFSLAARGEVQSVTLKDFGLNVNEATILEAIPFANNMAPGKLLLWSFAGQRVTPHFPIVQSELLRIIEEKFPNIPKAKNAFYASDGKRRKIVEAQTGVIPSLDPLKAQIEKHLTFLEHGPMVVEFRESQPTVFAAHLQANESTLLNIFPKKLELVHEKQKWEADFEKHPDWIQFDRKPYAVAADQLPFSMQWEPVSFSQFLNEHVAKVLEQTPENVSIARDSEGKIQLDGHAVSSHALVCFFRLRPA